jgi:hypothetical protein
VKKISHSYTAPGNNTAEGICDMFRFGGKVHLGSHNSDLTQLPAQSNAAAVVTGIVLRIQWQ